MNLSEPFWPFLFVICRLRALILVEMSQGRVSSRHYWKCWKGQWVFFLFCISIVVSVILNQVEVLFLYRLVNVWLRAFSAIIPLITCFFTPLFLILIFWGVCSHFPLQLLLFLCEVIYWNWWGSRVCNKWFYCLSF